MAGEDTVVTPHTQTPRQAEQVAAAEREAGAPRIPAGETDLATATIGDVDGGLPQPGPAPNAQPDAPQPKMPTVRSLNDEKRAAITAKWRTDRNQEATGGDDADQLASTVRSAGLPPEFAQQAEPAPQPEPEPPAAEVQPADSPPAETPSPQQKYKIKVRGEEREISHEELLALAQKSAAADSYLDEAKQRLDSAKNLENEIRAQRVAPQPGIHPAGQPNAIHPGAQPNAQPGSPQAPAPDTPSEDPFGKLVETIQFGDPEEAKELLRNTIGMTTAQMVQAGLQQARFRDEGARAAKVVKDFEAAHPDIAKDSKSRAAIEQDIYDQQRADLEEIGVDPNTLRQDGLAATPADIANAHRWFRVEQGMTSLKTPQQMLETAHDNFLEWKGIKTPNPAVPTPGPNTPTNQPRVAPVVHVDRTARRQAIPQQPSPTATPRPAPAPSPAPQTMDGRRSSIVQAMKGQRSKLRGSVGVQ
jgi:hypothetical protein